MELGDWRGKMLSRLRTLVKKADPDVVEEWKWRGVPAWSHDGLVCTGETYKNGVKMTFAKGAALENRSGLFNASLGGNTRRAIDFHEGDRIDEAASRRTVPGQRRQRGLSPASGRPVDDDRGRRGGHGHGVVVAGGAMPIVNGAHTIIYSRNTEADRAFFRDVLGLPNVDVGDGWLIFALPPAEVAVHPAVKNGVHELYLMTADLSGFVKTMTKRGVTCTPPRNQGWGVLTEVSLPGGSALGVYEPRHARPAWSARDAHAAAGGQGQPEGARLRPAIVHIAIASRDPRATTSAFPPLRLRVLGPWPFSEHQVSWRNGGHTCSRSHAFRKTTRLRRDRFASCRTSTSPSARGSPSRSSGRRAAARARCSTSSGALEPPSAGTVVLDGQNPFELDDRRLAAFRNRHVGFVFQDHHLLPQCSVLENVLVPTLVAREAVDGVEQRARDLIEQVGLTARLHHRPHELSGGEKQRVALARALVQHPGLVLCDEPTGNLDQESADAVASLLVDLHERQQSILIVVTHNLELAQRMDTQVHARRRQAGRPVGT